MGRPKDIGAAAGLLRLFHHELGGTEAAAAHKHVNKQKSCRELRALGSDDLRRQARFHPKTCHSFTSTGGCDGPWFPSQKVRTHPCFWSCHLFEFCLCGSVPLKVQSCLPSDSFHSECLWDEGQPSKSLLRRLVSFPRRFC